MSDLSRETTAREQSADLRTVVMTFGGDGNEQTSRVFVQPSLSEGFGFTPVEAMAGGCALVSTANGGSADYAIDGVTALVTPPRDSEAMAKRVEQLLVDEELRVRLARRGTEYGRMFDWDASAKRPESFLRQYDAAPVHFQQPPLLETSG